jgi:porphobilinogen synthase
MEHTIRLRRLRKNAGLRDMLAQVRLRPSDLVAPLFVRLGHNERRPIASMPGVSQLSPDLLVEELKRLEGLGVGGAMLFGVTEPAAKDSTGSHAHDENNAVCTALKMARDAGVGLVLMTDLCYCEYTSHGHCGPLTAAGAVDNDATVAQLGRQALLHARCGADVVAPSGMMDHQVAAIRAALEAGGQPDTAILAYAVKYASSYYGPFRDAAESPPQFGDRKGYQMDFRRDAGIAREALREARQDVTEGADLVMVKPGGPYLDVLWQVTQAVDVPTSVYQVSGEYALLKAAAERGWIDERGAVLEALSGFRRAGASFILTYYAGEAAAWL